MLHRAYFLLPLCLAIPTSVLAKNISAYKQLIQARSKAHIASLHEAAVSGNLAVTKAALAQGDSPNQRDEYGYTPVHLAAQSGQADVLRLLIKAGGDVMQPDAAGRVASQLTSNKDCKALCKQFEEKRRAELACYQAIQKNDIAALRQYLKQGGSANAMDASGQHSLLHAAISQRKAEAALILLSAGAKAEAPAAHGKNLLMLAAGMGDAQVIKALLQKGAKPMHQSGNGATALHDAIWENKVDAVNALLPAYKNINFSPSGRQNGFPIEMAISRRREAIVAAFVKAGFRADKAPVAQAPLLLLALEVNSLPIFQALLEAGANPDAKNAKGQSARSLAKGAFLQALNK